MFEWNSKRKISEPRLNEEAIYQESYRNLLEAFGDKVPSKHTVKRWFLEFKREITSLEDEPRSGRPPTAVTSDTIATVRSLIKEDSRITYDQIAESVSIGKAGIDSILYEHLGVRKLAARWIPHNLTNLQIEARVEVQILYVEKN